MPRSGALDPAAYLQMRRVYEEEVGPLPHVLPRLALAPDHVTLGGVTLPRGDHCTPNTGLLLLRSSLPTLHALATCVHHNWLAILVRSINDNTGHGPDFSLRVREGFCILGPAMRHR